MGTRKLQATAASEGFSMPPEWAPQRAVWLSWPLNPWTWPGCRDSVELAYASFASAISRFEEVRVNCPDGDERERASDLLADAGAQMENVRFFDFQTNDAWCRDHGPVFVKSSRAAETAVVDFVFNAWGGKFPPWDFDDAIPCKVAEALGLRRFFVPIVCEGGALEVNGKGLLMTTESVLLNKNRNPKLSKDKVEAALRGALGVEEILWLKSGLAGDDTDGHVDTLARFFRSDAVLAAVDDVKGSPHREALKANFAALKKFKSPSLGKLEIVPLPCPDPIRPEGWREDVLPASYANFLIVNGAVLVPTYRQDAKDGAALKAVGECFPRREVIPVDCFDIVLEGGALHCLSQQQPL